MNHSPDNLEPHGAPVAAPVSSEFRQALPKALASALRDAVSLGLATAVVPLDIASRMGIDPDHARPEHVGERGVSLSCLDDLKTMVSGVDLASTSLHFIAGASGLPIAVFLIGACEDAGVPTESLSGSLRCDPLGLLAETGSLPRSLRAQYDEMSTLVTWTRESAPRLRTIGVSTVPYHEAGASIPEELAFGIATAIEYIRECVTRGHLARTAMASLTFAVGVDADCLSQTAKQGAAQRLFAMVGETFGVADSAAELDLQLSGPLHGRVPGTAQNPAEPLEELTRSMVESAWDLTKRIEAKGGMYAALEEGFPQSRAALSRKQGETVETTAVRSGPIDKAPVAELSARCQRRREAVSVDTRADILCVLAEVASRSGPDAVETVMLAARSGATLGQISRALSHGGEPIVVDPLVR